MFGIIMDDVKTILAVFLVIVITQTIFFMVYSYWASGDVFLALRNFYSTMYHLQVI